MLWLSPEVVHADFLDFRGQLLQEAAHIASTKAPFCRAPYVDDDILSLLFWACL